MCLCLQVVRQSDSDCVTVIGAGVTLHEALSAADMLASEGKITAPPGGETRPLSPVILGHEGVNKLLCLFRDFCY